jgi:hypothetical protein
VGNFHKPLACQTLQSFQWNNFNGLKIKQQIDALNNELKQITGGEAGIPGPAVSTGRKRGRKKGSRRSPEARARMSEAQRRRWAAKREGKPAE